MPRIRQVGLSAAALLYKPIFGLLTRLLERVEAGELDWLLDFLNAKEPK